MMKVYLNCSVLNRWMGWKFGQECQAGLHLQNSIAQSTYEVGSLFIFYFSILSEYRTLATFFLGLFPLKPLSV